MIFIYFVRDLGEYLSVKQLEEIEWIWTDFAYELACCLMFNAYWEKPHSSFLFWCHYRFRAFIYLAFMYLSPLLNPQQQLRQKRKKWAKENKTWTPYMLTNTWSLFFFGKWKRRPNLFTKKIRNWWVGRN